MGKYTGIPIGLFIILVFSILAELYLGMGLIVGVAMLVIALVAVTPLVFRELTAKR